MHFDGGGVQFDRMYVCPHSVRSGACHCVRRPVGAIDAPGSARIVVRYLATARESDRGDSARVIRAALRVGNAARCLPADAKARAIREGEAGYGVKTPVFILHTTKSRTEVLGRFV